MDSAFAIYESAVENLKETTKEARNSAALLLNRLQEGERYLKLQK